MAFTGIAALVAGAEVTAPLVLSAIAEVGTAMSVVGAVTGSKDLMKIGGIMGIAGGIGSLVTSAGSSAASVAGTVGSAEAGAAPQMLSGMDMAADAPSGFAGSSTGMASGAGAVGDNIDAGGGWNPAGDAGGNAGIVGSAMQPSTGLGPDLSTGTTPASMTSDATAVQTPAGTTATPGAPAVQPTMLSGPDAAMGGPASAPGGQVIAGAAPGQTGFGTPVPAASFMDRMMGVFQNPANKTVLEMGAKLAGGALQGMQQQSMWNEKMGLERDRLKQTSYGSQVGQNRPHGIVNGARV